jgi:glucosamine 6-phosphate synthetase-like amidotransferase/phosphosugar isomerase protein
MNLRFDEEWTTMTEASSTPAMLADIWRTPDVVADLLARSEEFADFAENYLRPEGQGRLFAFGCGDGLFAATAMAGSAFVADTALDFLAYRGATLKPQDRVLAISMSGNVDRTVAAAEAARASGAGLAVLTNGDGGRLGALGAPRLSLDIASFKPFLCGTTSYTATLLALAILSRDVDTAALDAFGASFSRIAETALQSVRRLPGNMSGVRFLSAGPNAGSAAYGAAKLVELCRVPAWSCDIEEFAHSQFWAADPRDLIVYIVANKAVAEVATDSAAALNGMGFTTLALTMQDSPVGSAQTSITVPSVGETLSPIALALPLQLLAWHIAVATGFDPDTRAHLKDDELRFTTSRRLTRKSLIGTGH